MGFPITAREVSGVGRSAGAGAVALTFCALSAPWQASAPVVGPALTLTLVGLATLVGWNRQGACLGALVVMGAFPALALASWSVHVAHLSGTARSGVLWMTLGACCAAAVGVWGWWSSRSAAGPPSGSPGWGVAAGVWAAFVNTSFGALLSPGLATVGACLTFAALAHTRRRWVACWWVEASSWRGWALSERPMVFGSDVALPGAPLTGAPPLAWMLWIEGGQPMGQQLTRQDGPVRLRDGDVLVAGTAVVWVVDRGRRWG